MTSNNIDYHAINSNINYKTKQ